MQGPHQLTLLRNDRKSYFSGTTARPMRLTLLTLCFLLIGTLRAQCPDCTPDTACTVTPAYPTLCPESPPDATVGEYYEAVATFWMPPSFTDPVTGFTVSLQQMTITGVTGLPFGLGLTYNQPTGVFDPQEEQHGCARICGTPLAAGSYPVTISVLAQVTFSGIPLTIPEALTLYLTVLPGSGGNAGFTFSPTTGCGNTSVEFQALIDGSPSPTTYTWDFGDGTTGTSSTPPTHVYSTPGEYIITLQTTIGGLVLDQVDLGSVNGNWCGDIEEPNLPFLGCQGSPDPYFILTDGQGYTYTSSTADNSTAATWSTLGVPMNDPPYSISFHDEDAISSDDLLGTYNLTLNGGGSHAFNVAGGTTGTLHVTESIQETFNHTDTVLVFPLPVVQLAMDSATDALCVEGPSLLNYTWFLDGDTVPGLNTPCITPTGPGTWYAEITGSNGCTAATNTLLVCPGLSIIINGPVLQVPSGFVTYVWTYQGGNAGGNDPFLVIQGDGLYAVTATDANGCVVTAALELITAGVAQAASPATRVMVLPSPNNGSFHVSATGLRPGQATIHVRDATGRMVYRMDHPVEQGRLETRVAGTFAPGAYVLLLSAGGRVYAERFLVQ